MPSPRTRRLLLDAESIRTRLAGWPLIEISGAAGMPPEIYRFTYHLMALHVDLEAISSNYCRTCSITSAVVIPAELRSAAC